MTDSSIGLYRQPHHAGSLLISKTCPWDCLISSLASFGISRRSTSPPSAMGEQRMGESVMQYYHQNIENDTYLEM